VSEKTQSALRREQGWTHSLRCCQHLATHVCIEQSVNYWVVLMNNVTTVEYVCMWLIFFCRLKINHASIGHMHLFLNTAPSQTHIITFGFFTVNKIFNGEALCSIWKSNCPLSFIIREASRWRKGMWGTILCTVFHQASGTIWQEPSRASTTAQSIRMQIWCSVTKPLRNVPQYDYFMMFRSVHCIKS
jgi:hypothetical protein